MRKIIAKVMLVLTVFLILTPTVMAAQLGDRLLMEGSIGEDVAQLQQILDAQGFWSGYADGIFGQYDNRCFNQVSKGKGIKVDGIAGPETFSALNINVSSPYRGSTGRFSARDIELVAKLVYAEARGSLIQAK